MSVEDLHWLPATVADVPALDAVQAVVHPLMPEAEEVLTERIALCPEGCLILRKGQEIAGYVLSHPWLRGTPPPLDSLLGTVPASADVWYLHDLALLPSARGTGMAGAVVSRMCDTARAAGFQRMVLVSVNGSRGFWEKQGFEAVVTADLRVKLASYGPDAVYMEKVV